MESPNICAGKQSGSEGRQHWLSATRGMLYCQLTRSALENSEEPLEGKSRNFMFEASSNIYGKEANNERRVTLIMGKLD
jgi:hypothetical protein